MGLLLRGNTLFGLEVLFWLLCRLSRICGFLSRSLMSLVLLLSTENVSKLLAKKFQLIRVKCLCSFILSKQSKNLFDYFFFFFLHKINLNFFLLTIRFIFAFDEIVVNNYTFIK